MIYEGCEISTVWLDLDDTIIDFTTNAQAALHRLYEMETAISSRFPDADVWADCYERHNHQLWDAYSRAEISQDFLRLERFRRPLAEAGTDESEAIALARRYDHLYLDLLAEGRAMIPGATSLLDALKTDPTIKLGILSNGFREIQFRKIHNCGLDGRFDAVVLSDDIGVNKPDRRLFEHAMERTADPDPRHHLLIGDNPETDIRGALDAGWHAIWFHPARASHNIPCPTGAIETSDLHDLAITLGKAAAKKRNNHREQSPQAS